MDGLIPMIQSQLQVMLSLQPKTFNYTYIEIQRECRCLKRTIILNAQHTFAQFCRGGILGRGGREIMCAQAASSPQPTINTNNIYIPLSHGGRGESIVYTNISWPGNIIIMAGPK